MESWGNDRLTAIAVIDPTIVPSDEIYKEMNLLEQKHRGQPVNLIALYEDAQTDTRLMAEHAMEANLAWLALRDLNGSLATALEVQQVPSFVLLDKDRRVIYRGGLGTVDLAKPGLTLAIQEALDGKEISQPSVPYPGRDRSETADQTISYRTFTDHVAGILASRCQSCHTLGGMAPFPLHSFQDAVAHGDQIRDALISGRMPPTSLDSRFGKFSNFEELTKQESKNIIDWLDSGRNIGNANAAPRQATPITWHIDPPTTVVTTSQGIKIPAGNGLRAFYHLVPADQSAAAFAEERFANQLECRPTNSSIVRHLQAYIFPPSVEPTPANRWQAMATVTRTPSGREFYFPTGTAVRIPAGSQILFELLVGTTTKPLLEKPSLGMVFSTEPVQHEIRLEPIHANELKIDPYDPAAIRLEERRLAHSAELWGILPAMNLLGKEFRFSTQSSTEEPVTLLQIDRYNPAYRLTYWLYEPLRLGRGDRLAVEARWDHSRFSALGAKSEQPVVGGPLPDGESLDLWLMFRVPNSGATADRLLTNASALALSDSTRVLPQNPMSIPAAVTPRTRLDAVNDQLEGTWLAASTKPDDKQPWTSQVATAPFEVKENHLYVARFNVKGTENRRLSAILDDPNKLFQPCSDHQLFDVTSEPSARRLTFRAKKSHPAAAVCFYIGEKESPVEFASLIVEDYGDPGEIPFVTRNSSKQGITLRAVPNTNGRFRVEIPSDVGPTPWGDSIVGKSFPVEKGDSYSVTFLARAERLRKINVSLSQDHPPNQYVGVGQTVTLVRQWERYTIRGIIDRTDTIHLIFFVGGDTTNFELSDIEVIKH
jgi:hypothetical protein